MWGMRTDLSCLCLFLVGARSVSIGKYKWTICRGKVCFAAHTILFIICSYIYIHTHTYIYIQVSYHSRSLFEAPSVKAEHHDHQSCFWTNAGRIPSRGQMSIQFGRRRKEPFQAATKTNLRKCLVYSKDFW